MCVCVGVTIQLYIYIHNTYTGHLQSQNSNNLGPHFSLPSCEALCQGQISAWTLVLISLVHGENPRKPMPNHPMVFSGGNPEYKPDI